MITQASPYLLRFGGHKGAGGLTVELSHLDQVLELFQDYCRRTINPEDLEKTMLVDTVLLSHEWNDEELSEIAHLAPF